MSLYKLIFGVVVGSLLAIICFTLYAYVAGATAGPIIYLSYAILATAFLIQTVSLECVYKDEIIE